MHSLKHWIAALVLSLAILAGSAGAQDLTCTGVEIRAGALIFGDSFESGDLSAWGSTELRFQATRILDLDLVVLLPEDFSGDHVLHVKLETPKGHHYQTLTVPISSDAGRVGTSRRVDGYPRPLEVHVAGPTLGQSGQNAVVQHLPVAGTSIVSSALYGKWTATAYLDDQVQPCADPGSFFISP